MKKLTAFILCVIFVLSLCGCKSNSQIQSYYSYYETVDVSSEQEYSSDLQNNSQSKTQKSWESTVATPSKVVFYKGGQAIEQTDKAANLKIAKQIESYFKGNDKLLKYNSIITDSMVTAIKGQDMAVEVFFDVPTTFYGKKIIDENTIFIPVSGQKKGMLIEKRSSNYDRSSGPLGYYPQGLEKFFPDAFNQPEKLGPPEYCAIDYKYAGGKYVGTEKADKQKEYDTNDLYVFKNGDGVVIKQDSKTKEVLLVDFGVITSHSASPLTEEAAKEAAKNCAGRIYNLSSYDKQTVEKITTGMMVTFTKTISGIDTYQYIKVRVNEDKTISSITKTPDAFDGIDTSKISVTEEQIIKTVEQNHIEKYGDDFSRLEIFSIKITVKDAKLKAKVCYQEIRQQNNNMTDGKTIETYIDLQ